MLRNKYSVSLEYSESDYGICREKNNTNEFTSCLGETTKQHLGGENLHLGNKRDDVCSALGFLVQKLRTWLYFISE